MEDILASIKRIIAEDADGGAHVRARRRAAPPVVDLDDRDHDERHDVLDLNEPAPSPVHFQPEPPAIEPMPMSPPVAEMTDAMPAAPTKSESIAPAAAAPVNETIVSPATAEASRAPLDTLSKLVEKPEAPAADGITLDAMVREMLRPMLREWLDKNLPPMVEALVAKEIARIVAGR
ncbi:DUF2497 domain-containing protein [Sphingomonas sp.]|uniref:DUF2497 domain-containing protein n=1 Tax=Sphingomonas sp. TaxID=28214 RepID=UPI0025ED976E|nr:DUF2497 domain-containing protein [Sphingomonas sp.]